jgi:hypothetical protein
LLVYFGCRVSRTIAATSAAKVRSVRQGISVLAEQKINFISAVEEGARAGVHEGKLILASGGELIRGHKLHVAVGGL